MGFLGSHSDGDSAPSKHAFRVIMTDLLLSRNEIDVPPSFCVPLLMPVRPSSIEQEVSYVSMERSIDSRMSQQADHQGTHWQDGQTGTNSLLILRIKNTASSVAMI